MMLTETSAKTGYLKKHNTHFSLWYLHCILSLPTNHRLTLLDNLALSYPRVGGKIHLLIMQYKGPESTQPLNLTFLFPFWVSPFIAHPHSPTAIPACGYCPYFQKPFTSTQGRGEYPFSQFCWGWEFTSREGKFPLLSWLPIQFFCWSDTKGWDQLEAKVASCFAFRWRGS